MTYLYYKDEQLKMMSETPIETELDFIEKNLTKEESEKIKNINWERKIENGELVFEKSQAVLDKETKIDEINKATTITELKEILLNLIK